MVPAKKRKRCPDLTGFGRAAKESRRSADQLNRHEAAEEAYLNMLVLMR